MIMVKAYAKINLGLKILGKDIEDGYHILNMVELPLELHDRIEIYELPEGYDEIITCDDRNIPTDETNLVAKTMKVLRENFDIKKKYRIHIHKIIPVGAGLGGGSADAAIVLHAFNKALKLNLSTEKLNEIGSKIGSDVPFCLLNKACHISGKGETLEQIKVKKGFDVIIAKPKKGLSTKEVYEKYDDMVDTGKGDVDLLIKGLEENNEALIKENLVNDLEKPAISLNPDIQVAKDIMKEQGLELVQMTGSGSCVFGLYRGSKKLEEVEKALNKSGFKTFITKTL
jgi:4-diphosphocytidyl-2-C-methyl-D-erythritol kinase